jgi:hypothetical protein
MNKIINRIVIFSLVWICFLAVVTSASAQLYREDWKALPRTAKYDYLHGLCDGELFGLRCAYILDVNKFTQKSAQIIPLGSRIYDLVDEINLFYQREATEKISVSWALYIISQEKQSMQPEKLEELKQTAIKDYDIYHTN